MTEELVGGLASKQREKLNFTRPHIRRIALMLTRAGECRGLTKREIAGMILDRLISENGPAFRHVQATTKIDWEALIDFIERLLPLILQIIAIFA